MPRAPRFKIAAVDELLRQLEFAPAETRRKQMNAAEQLIADLDPRQNYPQDFIIYRITGYRPDASDEPVTFVGEALLPDLVNLVQMLSATVEAPATREGRVALTLEEVAQRLSVSQKTVQRYRRQGLVCHCIVFAEGERRLGCYADALERFAATHHDRLKRAGQFARIGGDREAAIIAEARRLRETERLSLNEAALRLARTYGRAHETIRMLLHRHDRAAGGRNEPPIFVEPGPLSERAARVIHRAWLRGVEPAALAQRFGKSKPTIHRALMHRRAELLRALQIEFVRLPTFARQDAHEVILAAPAAVLGLNDLPPDDDAIGLITNLLGAEPADETTEHALVAAYNLLKMRAAQAIGEPEPPRAGGEPGAEALDVIETDLRGAAKLQRRLVALGLPAALRRIEQYLGRPLLEQPGDAIVKFIDLVIPVVVEAVDGLDPSHGSKAGSRAGAARGQRLERLAGFAMDRRLARLNPASAGGRVAGVGGRAAARHAPGSMPIAPRLEQLAPWAWLELRRDLRTHVSALEARLRRLVEVRYGLTGEPPCTLEATARQLGTKPIKAARDLQRAVRELRAIARATARS